MKSGTGRRGFLKTVALGGAAVTETSAQTAVQTTQEAAGRLLERRAALRKRSRIRGGSAGAGWR